MSVTISGTTTQIVDVIPPVAQIVDVVSATQIVDVVPTGMPVSLSVAFGTYTVAGPVTPSTGKARLPSNGNYTLAGAIATISTAPTGSSLIVDVLKNGTTIYTTAANRPTIPASGFVSQTMATPDVTAMAVNDYLTINITQVGSTVAGADLTVTVFATRLP